MGGDDGPLGGPRAPTTTPACHTVASRSLATVRPNAWLTATRPRAARNDTAPDPYHSVEEIERQETGKIRRFIRLESDTGEPPARVSHRRNHASDEQIEALRRSGPSPPGTNADCRNHEDAEPSAPLSLARRASACGGKQPSRRTLTIPSAWPLSDTRSHARSDGDDVDRQLDRPPALALLLDAYTGHLGLVTASQHREESDQRGAGADGCLQLPTCC